jgi:hypothetical protein
VFHIVEPWHLVLATVAVLAAVQSVFGVGLLVFGTPTLLIIGLDFPVILAYLLPCSLVISCLQVRGSGGLTLEPIRKEFLIYTAPTVLVATAAAVFLGSPDQTGVAVGTVLMATALLRVLPLGRRAVTTFVRHYRPGLLVGLGVVHGLSNVGGGILTAIVGSTFDDKHSIRRHIAFCYGLMATLQLAVVLLDRPPVQPVLWLALPPLAGAVYLVAGQWLFLKTGRATYQHALTALLAVFGLLLVAR